jgi:carboxyl-terminal processing protease
MLPAVNKGVGANMGFPDVCLTPAPPGPPVPLPYPNVAMHAMAAPFAPNVLISMMPALNVGSLIPMTSGMEPGLAHPFYKQMGMFLVGDPTVMVNALPGVALTHPTTGNMANNAVGVVAVPSITTVFYSLAGAEPAADTASEGLDVAALGSAVEACSDDPVVDDVHLTADGAGHVAVRRFTSSVPAQVHHAIVQLVEAGMTELVIDLRGNPGGDAAAALALAGDFVEKGTILAVMVDADGDRTVHLARGATPHGFPLTIRVDRATASAAELLAGSLQALGRGVVVGERTYGKGTVATVAGGRYGLVGHWELPGGRALDGVGVEPIEADRAQVAEG